MMPSPPSPPPKYFIIGSMIGFNLAHRFWNHAVIGSQCLTISPSGLQSNIRPRKSITGVETATNTSHNARKSSVSGPQFSITKPIGEKANACLNQPQRTMAGA
ncbi:hypothetical protein D3C81_1833990 [compost metagenome]